MTTSLKTFSLLGKALPQVSLEFTAIFKNQQHHQSVKLKSLNAEIYRYIQTIRLPWRSGILDCDWSIADWPPVQDVFPPAARDAGIDSSLLRL